MEEGKINNFCAFTFSSQFNFSQIKSAKMIIVLVVMYGHHYKNNSSTLFLMPDLIQDLYHRLEKYNCRCWGTTLREGLF